MTIYRKYTEWGRRINIEKGETYCPKCDGRGCMFGSTSVGGVIKLLVVFVEGMERQIGFRLQPMNRKSNSFQENT